jgi:hypothetical protein
MRTARFLISCGMFSIAVLNLQERLLRRRSGGVNVSHVVSGIRCHRYGLLWCLCRYLSRFFNVRALACIGRPYSGERCCSSAITRERNSLVRHDSLLREKVCVRTAPQLPRAGDQGPPALAPANNGVIRRFAAIVPRRAIALVARRIGFLLHSSDSMQEYDVSCTKHERSVSRTLAFEHGASPLCRRVAVINNCCVGIVCRCMAPCRLTRIVQESEVLSK